MLKIGLVTCAKLPELTPDDRLLQEELQRRGHLVRGVVWSEERGDWREFDQLVIRSCWDYHLRPAEFGAWLAAMEAAGVPLWNPAALVRWNMHKAYLQDLAAGGVPVVPTLFLEQGTRASLAELLAEQGWSHAVMKPAISASAFRTSLVARDQATAAQASLDGLLAAGDVLVQRFVPEVRSQGEWSVVFLGGAFSHAVLKRPGAGDFRVQNELGGSSEPGQPAPRILEAARRIAAHIPEPWLYARVDGIELEGRFTLMELELIEPVLFLSEAPAAAARMADALLRRSPAGATIPSQCP
jgi:glutathione synthase/RimK-type ligase-like ATP-grasp enzyme